MAQVDVSSVEPGLPRGPRGSWLMGSMADYNADPLAFVTSTVRQYGDFVPLRLGPIRGLLLSDPNAIESVLVEHNKSFRKSAGVRRLATLLGNGIFLSEGALWLRHRRLMQPALNRASVERHAETMVERIAAALDRWATTDVVEVLPETHRLALEIATQTLFGSDVTEVEAREIGQAMELAATQLQTRVSSLLMFLPDWIPTPGNRRMSQAIARMDNLVFGIIDGRRRSNQRRDDLLGLLLAESERAETRMTDRELRDEVITLLVAGHETTAITLGWAMYEIARHPLVGAELREEAIRMLGPDRSPTPSDIHNLPVASGIVNETLRLYPAGYLTAREAIADVVITGHTVKKGTLVLISQWEQHRDPTTFADADVFRPDRWRGSLSGNLKRGEFFPFGLGPRMCIGAPFANMELMLALPMIARRFLMEGFSPAEPRPVPKLTLNPDRPIRLRLTSVAAG